jgi:hypothetical protein
VELERLERRFGTIRMPEISRRQEKTAQNARIILKWNDWHL